LFDGQCLDLRDRAADNALEIIQREGNDRLGTSGALHRDKLLASPVERQRRVGESHVSRPTVVTVERAMREEQGLEISSDPADVGRVRDPIAHRRIEQRELEFIVGA
jgi:hypothetical protein